MKATTIINKANKIGADVEVNGRQLTVKVGDRVLEGWISGNQEMNVVNVRDIDDVSDAMIDYSAGQFYETIKSAFYALTR